ncbi:MAG: hypothetical protein E7666_04705 [Ruminococcaceae bacterium]|nr:hypothetical protein [Oscillospiraceae bacterium]
MKLLKGMLCLLLLCVLSSCQTKEEKTSFLDVIEPPQEEAFLAGEAQEIEELRGYWAEKDLIGGRYTVFSKAIDEELRACVIYDILNDKITYRTDLTINDKYYIVEWDEELVPVLAFQYDEQNRTQLIRASDGAVLAEKNGLILTRKKSVKGYFSFGNMVYRIDGEQVDAICEEKQFPDVNEQSEKYLYDYSSSGFTIFDRNAQFIMGHPVPSYQTGAVRVILKNGELLYQKMQVLPADSQEFDLYLSDEKKYTLHTYLLDPATKTVTEIPFDYVIRGSEQILPLKADCPWTWVCLAPIENKCYDLHKTEYVLLDGELKIQGRLNELVNGAKDVVEYHEEGFVVLDHYGMYHYLDWSGAARAVLPSKYSFANGFYSDEGGVYDLALNKLVDYEETGYSIETLGSDFIILTRKTEKGKEYARLYDGKIEVVLEKETNYKRYYTIRDCTTLYQIYGIEVSGDFYRFYNAKGDCVITIKLSPVNSLHYYIEDVIETENAIILVVFHDGANRIYRFDNAASSNSDTP